MSVKGLALSVLCTVATISGCGGLPPADCQVRAGTMAGEAGYDPFGGVTGEGGAASLAGCTAEDAQHFRVFTVSPTGSLVCFGPSEWCDKVSEGAKPVILSVDQLRELADGGPE